MMCYDIVMVTALNCNRHRKGGAFRWRFVDLMHLESEGGSDDGLVIYLASVRSVYHHEQHAICGFRSLEKVQCFDSY